MTQSRQHDQNKKVKFAYSTRNIKNPWQLGQFDEDDIENIASQRSWKNNEETHSRKSNKISMSLKDSTTMALKMAI